MKSGLGPFPPALPASLITGSGTTDFIPVWTAATTLGNSLIKQVAGIVTLQGTAALSVPTVTILNTSKIDGSTPLQLQASVIDLIFSVEATGKIWTINASAAAGKLILDGNGELILKATLGEVLIQDSTTAAMSDINMFPNVLAMAIPAGLKISGRNLTDSAQRTLRIAMSPTIDNCVLFSGVGKYCFDDNIDIIRSAAALITFSSAVTGDSDFRFRLNADGKTQWGSGAAAPDVSLERSAASELKIDGKLHVLANTGSTVVGTARIINAYGPAVSFIRALSLGGGAGGDGSGVYVSLQSGSEGERLRIGGIRRSGVQAFEILTISNVSRFRQDVNGRMGFSEVAPASAIDIDDDAGGTDMGYMTLQELSTDAAAPAANHCALYCKDVGGKTALFARFNTGAVQQISIEP